VLISLEINTRNTSTSKQNNLLQKYFESPFLSRNWAFGVLILF